MYRHDFGVSGIPGRFQAPAIADTGRIDAYKSPFALGANNGRLSSTGLGLHWTLPSNWIVVATVSYKIGSTAELLRNADTKSRAWVQLQKGF